MTQRIDWEAPVDLKGEVAIVTGGGRGLGRAIAQALAQAGAAVTIAARSTDELAETARLIGSSGGRSHAVETDVTVPADVARMVAETEEYLGPVTLLVNNAGVPGPGGVVWETPADEWWRCLDINLRGPLLCSQAVLSGMVARRKGRIVNMASGAGLGASAYGSAYGVSKTAIIRLSEDMAIELRPHHVQVFSARPGPVRTRMTETIMADASEERASGLQRIFTEGEDVPPERVADLIVQVAAGRADALSGAFLDVDEDLHQMVARADRIQRDGRYRLRLKR